MAAPPKDGSSSKRGERKRKWAPDFPYAVDYNDHFETPLVAYEDIAPLLDWLSSSTNNNSNSNTRSSSSSSKKRRKDHVIYDPYYCDGQTTSLFRQLGFDGIINRKRDFYQDIQDKTIPKDFKTVVTNPPYSDTHKEKCLDFCFDRLRQHQKSFFLLMPNYVASREYYRTKEQEGDVVYLLPSQPYEYNHPEGTGKEIPPFTSLWFCGIGKKRVQQVQDFWDSMEWNHSDRTKPVLVTSLEALRDTGIIPTQKRPNPRQRKKKRQHAVQAQGQAHSQVSIDSSNTSRPSKSNAAAQVTGEPTGKSGKKSKYRSGTGQRQKKRF